jgi:HK97 family phage prohead protease
MEKQYKNIQVECKKLEKANTISAVFSTSDMDRHGEIVLQNWELENYKSNPVILNSHNSFDATEVIGKANMIEVKDGKLQGEIEFAVEENPKAKVIHDLYAGGFLRAFSVGFVPKEWADMDVITMAELLEISAVSVPANQMALAKAKGINVELLKTEETIDEVVEENEVIEEVVEEAPKEENEDEEPVVDKDEIVEEVVNEEAKEIDEEVEGETAVEDKETKLLNAVKALREELKGRTLANERKKAINKAIRELLKAKKS